MDANDQLAYALLLQQPTVNNENASDAQQAANASLAALQSTLLANAAVPQPTGQLQQAMAAIDLLKLLQPASDAGITSSGDHTTQTVSRGIAWLSHKTVCDVFMRNVRR